MTPTIATSPESGKDNSGNCEFCENPPTVRHEPVSAAVAAAWGHRYSCDRHRHWVRRLAHLDLGGAVRLREVAL